MEPKPQSRYVHFVDGEGNCRAGKANGPEREETRKLDLLVMYPAGDMTEVGVPHDAGKQRCQSWHEKEECGRQP